MSQVHSPSRWAAAAIAELEKMRITMQTDPGEEIIHQFRVLYKKTRALYRMAGMMSTGKAFRLKKAWKQVYQGAGTVRDTQLLHKLVITQMGEGPLAVLLRSQLATHQDSFNAILQQSDPGKEHFDQWKKADDYDGYFRTISAELRTYYRQPLYDEELHVIRKLLKDILYNQAWVTKMGQSQTVFISQLPITEIDSLQKLLGDYQDNVVQSAIVRRLAVLPAVRQEAARLEAWISGSFRNQVDLRSQAESALENFFHLHAPRALDQ
ncbi:CHAD domain-containing protein [Flavihumibacter stibioxidans]|uniref:CHAD domain-containing protein n=1 Tax=Flavihumibacter stibioxidans TaxID=1834163 RepID=A0ABR7M6E0_9BACT|nr:CHAD domain-containing protein [Flavihumibacter stibioxidans]MBC6490579.1 hypothetical protein [Flavihumibacter stibioxidans]